MTFYILKLKDIKKVQPCMNITPLRTLALTGAAITLLSLGATKASAAVYVSVGTPPPPPPAVVYRPWAPPYAGAVWIGGHNEWINGRWVWVGGYYSYPPRPHAVWVQPRYHHGRYYNGYWR